MKLSNKEIENVLLLNSEERYKYFIKRVADFEVMYSIIDENKNWVLYDTGEKIHFFLWSAKEYVDYYINFNKLLYSVKEIQMEQFEDELVDFIDNNNYLLNVFSVSNKSGFVLSIDDFITDLNNEYDSY